MELKAKSLPNSITLPEILVNPFNGIESLMKSASVATAPLIRIHSMELKDKEIAKALLGIARKENPFNGIEREYYTEYGGVTYSEYYESIQWN